MDSPWPRDYARNALGAAAIVVLFLAVAFAPFLVGPYSLMASASDVPSIYTGGAAHVAPSARPRKEVDPGAPGWQNEPWLAIEHRMLGRHEAPWWDSYDGYGQPFAAAQQAQPFFPLTYLAALHPSPRVWNWFYFARLALAGAFGALFVAWFGGRTAAIAGGIATALCGYYVAYYSMPHLSVEVLVPALFWSGEWLVRRPSAGAIAAAAGVMGLQFLGGMPESMVLAVGTVAAYVGLRLALEGRFGLVPLLPFAGAFVIAAAVGGVVLLPLIELLAHSYDTHRFAQFVIGLSSDGLHPLKMLMLQLAPLAYGPPFADLTQNGGGFTGLQGFVGSVGPFAAIVALFAAFRRRTPAPVRAAVGALAAIAAFYLLKNQGFPLVNWIGGLPVLRLVIFPKYDQALIGVAIGLLCGLGTAACERAWARQRDVAAAFAVVLLALTAGYAYAVVRVPVTPSARLFYFAAGFATVALLAGAAALAWRSPRGRGAFAAVTALAALGQYYVPVYGFISELPRVGADPYSGAPYVSALRSRIGDTRARVLGLSQTLVPNWGGALALDTPNSLNALYPSRYLPFLDAFLGTPADPQSEDLRDRFDGFSSPSLATERAHRWLTLSSVRYVAVPADRRTHGRGLHLAYDADARLYEFDAPLPRASVFHAVRGVTGERDALAALTDPALDVRRTIVIEGMATAAGTAAGAAERARIVAGGASDVAIDAHLVQPGYVMLNDMNYPGWVADVDGRTTPVLQADDLFRAVAVPAGTHRITFAYRSPAVGRGIVTTALGLAALLACVAFAVLRRRRTFDSPPPEGAGSAGARTAPACRT